MSIWFKPIGFGVYWVSTNWTALFIGLIWLVQMGLDIGNQWTVCPIDISIYKKVQLKPLKWDGEGEE